MARVMGDSCCRVSTVKAEELFQKMDINFGSFYNYEHFSRELVKFELFSWCSLLLEDFPK